MWPASYLNGGLEGGLGGRRLEGEEERAGEREEYVLEEGVRGEVGRRRGGVVGLEREGLVGVGWLELVKEKRTTLKP